MTERLSAEAAKRVGFDAQLTRCVDARRLDRLMRTPPVLGESVTLRAWPHTR